MTQKKRFNRYLKSKKPIYCKGLDYYINLLSIGNRIANPEEQADLLNKHQLEIYKQIVGGK